MVGDTVALQCKALGSPPPRITWLRNDQPLRPSERHHFTPGNQLLVIGAATLEDAGRYTCLMSNTLGTERAHSQLLVKLHRGSCASPVGPSTVTIGIIVIAVVTSIVVTSLVWVCIIYQTRKKSEECSVTNTGELFCPVMERNERFHVSVYLKNKHKLQTRSSCNGKMFENQRHLVCELTTTSEKCPLQEQKYVFKCPNVCSFATNDSEIFNFI